MSSPRLVIGPDDTPSPRSYDDGGGSEEKKDDVTVVHSGIGVPTSTVVSSMEQKLASARERLAALQLAHVESQIRVVEAAIRAAAAPPAIVTHPSLTTPVRPPLQPRRLGLFTSVKPPSSAVVAQQASINELPDAVPQAPVTATSSGSAAGTDSGTPRKAVTFRAPMPAKFTGTDEKQNADIEPWCEEINGYLDNYQDIPATEHIKKAKMFFSGPALTWWKQKQQEVDHAGKSMTWEWLQGQLIKDYGRANGESAKRAKWQALRMGMYGDEPTRTVKQYTKVFLDLMNSLTPHHQVTTEDMLVIDRYLKGIEDGYPVLYTAMKGADTVLYYPSLSAARDGAEVAESELAAKKIGQGVGRRTAGAGVEVSNLWGDLDQDDITPGEAPSVNVVTTGATVARRPSDGRHVLTPAEKQMLYNGKRCYRCYAVHPFGAGHPKCNKPVQKSAPLNL
jgi:Retrotransposon gag protein